MYKGKPYHYWRVHKEAMEQVWENFSLGTRQSIAGDVGGKSEDFVRFVNLVDKSTDIKFNNPNYYMNDKYSFKYPQY
jgi:hypothetical protein